ncbi:3-galactosyl-N-acetylglucosaminide 4-alpha-L-fucosyltransferase FUT3 [Pimephales promelas]|nr:3-galactosyl-N-acetylglucosaminide 4-alpha-L-fucosyltransferase FUT3 [Pimephales promelas]
MPKLPRPAFQKWIWWNMESPTNSALHPPLKDLFNLTSSYRRDSDIPVPYGWLSEATEEEKNYTIPKKDKLVCWVNSIHRDYITEKVFNPLRIGTVPVVIGPPRENYEQFIPSEAFIHVDDFPSPKELADHLKLMDQNEDLYRQYFTWRKHFVSKHTSFGLAHACRVCDHIKKNKHYTVVKDINSWYWEFNTYSDCMVTKRHPTYQSTRIPNGGLCKVERGRGGCEKGKGFIISRALWEFRSQCTRVLQEFYEFCGQVSIINHIMDKVCKAIVRFQIFKKVESF